jgi:hypothetical protein
VVVLLFLITATRGDEPTEKPDLALQASTTAYEQNQKQFKDNPDYLVLPGLLANRKDKTVLLYGRATGLGPGDPSSFSSFRPIPAKTMRHSPSPSSNPVTSIAPSSSLA